MISIVCTVRVCSLYIYSRLHTRTAHIHFLGECGGDFTAPQRKNISPSLAQKIQRIELSRCGKIFVGLSEQPIYVVAPTDRRESANKNLYDYTNVLLVSDAKTISPNVSSSISIYLLKQKKGEHRARLSFYTFGNFQGLRYSLQRYLSASASWNVVPSQTSRLPVR